MILLKSLILLHATLACLVPQVLCREPIPNELLRIFVNLFNEINRSYGLYSRRPDFNYWFSTREWRLQQNPSQEYDFIIVGSGSAGSVIANRLSEIKEWNILLLEAGIPETNLMGVPVLASAFQFTDYNWHYFMEYQKDNFFGLVNDQMHWPRGRALGGTSTINYMIYTRGNRWDYDRWARDGNPGWSYEQVLPYFLKSQGANNLTDIDTSYHNENGYQSVENIYRSPLVTAFIEGGKELGLPHIDYNSPRSSFGTARIQATIKNGRRHSVANSFLWPARKRKNLDIITSAYVTKILINKQTKEAYGVKYERKGSTYEVHAKREVILSAGAFHSPQLLMLAGIGPREHLEHMGINVIQDLPVGQNLHDHLTFPGLAFLIDQDIDIHPPRVIPTTKQYNYNGTGPYTSLGGVEGIGYVKTHLADYPEDYPDMELLFVGGTLASDYGLSTYRGMYIKDEVFDSIFRPIYDKHHWTVFPMLLHPKSTGYMELKSKNPYDHPRFFGNFFSDPENQDIRTFIAAIRIIQQISNTTAFQNLGSRLNPRPMKTCQHLPFDSDEYWECCLRSISVTLHHQVGTAKMGRPEDPTSVVNAELQVYGMSRLRVADCSIIPRALGAHTNAPSIMVGEKAADLIKEFWGAKSDKDTNIQHPKLANLNSRRKPKDLDVFREPEYVDLLLAEDLSLDKSNYKNTENKYYSFYFK